MDLRRSIAGRRSTAARKPFFRRSLNSSASIGGDTLSRAAALPRRVPRPHRRELAWAPRQIQRIPDRIAGLRHVVLLGDAFIAAGCCVLAVMQSSVPMGVAATIWFLALSAPTVSGSAREVHSLGRVASVGVLAICVLSVAAVFAADRGEELPPGARVGVVALALGTFAAVAIRLLARVQPVAAALGSDQPESIILVGDQECLETTVAQWTKSGDRERIAGLCLLTDEAVGDVPEIEGIAVFGGLSEAPAAALRTRAHTVAVLPGPGLCGEALRKVGWELERGGVELSMATPMLDVAHHRASVDVVGSQLMVRVSHSLPAGIHALVKGIVDRALAAVLLVLVAPVVAVIALAVRLDSPGPALFHQQRVREEGRLFTMLKFRTMRIDAERAKSTLMALNDHGNGILFKMRNDPRVTRVGRVLRATSLDELPQLVNVLRGEMSLVGPRPALPSEVEQYDDWTHRRLAVKPGLTGLWQVSGRSDLSWDESVRLDLHYVDNWRHGLDLGILARTVRAVLRRQGAC
jgi:exopolysaccharide biosynthesis polyprenyl glycosylphosphotransferase